MDHIFEILQKKIGPTNWTNCHTFGQRYKGNEIKGERPACLLQRSQ